MGKGISSKQLLSRHVGRQDRVLLINPPVVETRYSWIRWNQPLDLLKLATHLRATVRCHVELFDFMKPDRDGEVREEFEPLDRRYRPRGGQRYPMRIYGRSQAEFFDWIYKRRTNEPKKLPTQVWVSSLCWYWFGSIAQMCLKIRELLPDAKIVLLGNYPILQPEHAATRCDADFAVVDRPELPPRAAAFDLYGNDLPPFLALQVESPKVALEEISWGVSKRILDFAFFSEDVLLDGGEALREIVARAAPLDRHVRFHLICGLQLDRVTKKNAALLAGRNIAALHFEEANRRGELDVDLYKEVRSRLGEAGLDVRNDDRLSGFVWIGRPHDRLESLVERSFRVLDTFGNLILKPYSPLPGSDEYRRHKSHLDSLALADWSPHFFPFSEVNGISCGEYHDLYRLAAFLNEKVRSRSFDFLQNTLGATFLKLSLEKEVWKLAPSPLRVVN